MSKNSAPARVPHVQKILADKNDEPDRQEQLSRAEQTHITGIAEDAKLQRRADASAQEAQDTDYDGPGRSRGSI